MLICHSKKFLFIAMPKTGSESVQEMLAKYSEVRSPKGDKTSAEKKASGFHNHITARALMETFQREGWNWDDYFSFTLIRNPWDRIVSMYEYGRQTAYSRQHDKVKEAGDFAGFVRTASIRGIERHAFSPDGEMLVRKIIRLEDVGTELPPVLQQLGVRASKVPHVNKTKRRPYQEYYDKATEEYVRDRFAKDIEVGNYCF